MNAGRVTANQLVHYLELHPEVKAFVVFAGLPPLSRALMQKLEFRSLKLVTVGGYSPDVRRWLESRVLALAVIPRYGEPPPENPAPKSAKDWLDREFELVTPESAERLPY